MDLLKLKTLIELVSASDITELEVTEDNTKIRVIKSKQEVPTGPITPTNTTQALPLTQPTIKVEQEAPAQQVVKQDESQQESGHTVTSPMVGTFYRASSPEADPFVKVGDTVAVGDPLCIVEAMKILNEIQADQAGTIKKILVENTGSVEYGQPLFIIA
jgi:acetyl-CoA carboxylase biotin carboxyl carrier protein